MSPRSNTSDAYGANTMFAGSSSPSCLMNNTSGLRAKTDLGSGKFGSGKIDFDSIYKYPLNDDTRSTLYTSNKRGGSTIKDRGSPYAFKERGSPYLNSAITREIPTSSALSP